MEGRVRQLELYQARQEHETRELRAHLDRLHRDVHGPGPPPSLRERVHSLEGTAAAARAAQAALAEAGRMRREQVRARWTRGEVLIALALLLLTVLNTLAALATALAG